MTDSDPVGASTTVEAEAPAPDGVDHREIHPRLLTDAEVGQHQERIHGLMGRLVESIADRDPEVETVVVDTSAKAHEAMAGFGQAAADNNAFGVIHGPDLASIATAEPYHPFRDGRPTYEIGKVVTHPHFARRGYAKSLIAHAIRATLDRYPDSPLVVHTKEPGIKKIMANFPGWREVGPREKWDLFQLAGERPDDTEFSRREAYWQQYGWTVFVFDPVAQANH